jgi:hypothetical protein
MKTAESLLKLFLTAGSLTALFLWQSSAFASPCFSPGTVSFQALPDGVQYVELNLGTNWQSAPPSQEKAITIFKNMVSSKTSTDPIYLLSRQRDIFRPSFPKVAAAKTQVIDGKIGAITRANCLETSLLNAILEKYPKSNKVEYAALILKRKFGTDFSYKAHVITWGTFHVPPSAELDKILNQDIMNGWQLYSHLHNHPFYLENHPDDIAGTTYPSSGDLILYEEQQELGLEEAWVTNGFHTLKLDSEEFLELKRLTFE